MLTPPRICSVKPLHAGASPLLTGLVGAGAGPGFLDAGESRPSHLSFPRGWCKDRVEGHQLSASPCLWTGSRIVPSTGRPGASFGTCRLLAVLRAAAGVSSWLWAEETSERQDQPTHQARSEPAPSSLCRDSLSGCEWRLRGGLRRAARPALGRAPGGADSVTH